MLGPGLVVAFFLSPAPPLFGKHRITIVFAKFYRVFGKAPLSVVRQSFVSFFAQRFVLRWGCAFFFISWRLARVFLFHFGLRAKWVCQTSAWFAEMAQQNLSTVLKRPLYVERTPSIQRRFEGAEGTTLNQFYWMYLGDLLDPAACVGAGVLAAGGVAGGCFGCEGFHRVVARSSSAVSFVSPSIAASGGMFSASPNGSFGGSDWPFWNFTRVVSKAFPYASDSEGLEHQSIARQSGHQGGALPILSRRPLGAATQEFAQTIRLFQIDPNPSGIHHQSPDRSTYNTYSNVKSSNRNQVCPGLCRCVLGNDASIPRQELDPMGFFLLQPGVVGVLWVRFLAAIFEVPEGSQGSAKHL